MILKAIPEISDLLLDYLQSRLDTADAENFICQTMHKMCVESLPPEAFDKWEEVCTQLFNNRKNLRGTLMPF